MKTAVPSSPAELLAALTAIFPNFAPALAADEESELTYHGLFLFEFNPFFAKHIREFTPKQLKAFALLIAHSSIVPGSLENAIDTCFLEHTRQLKVNRELGKYWREAQKELAR